MNRNTTIGLLVVFAALLLYWLIVQRPSDEAKLNATSTPSTVQSGRVWPTLQADQILNIKIEDRANGRSVAFGREAAVTEWKVSEPEARPADQLAAASNAATLANLAYSSVLTPTTDLASFGIVSPTQVIEVKLVDGTTVRTFVGDKTPMGDSYYVMNEGGPSLLVVSSASLGALLGWLDQPPYLQPTATPELTATVEITPTLGLDLSPTPTP